MGKPKNLTGKRFGRLVALEITDQKSSNGSYLWKCLCDCGQEKCVPSGNLNRGTTNSCGCLAKEQLDRLVKANGGSRHDYRDHPVYISWTGLLYRAKSTTLKNYEDVSVCDDWNPMKGGSFLNFLRDMGLPKEGESINRINGAKVYSKDTCEWADRSIQGYDQKINVRNKTGVTGVYQKKDGKFRAKISKDRNVIFLGDFETLAEATVVRKEAELKYFGFEKESN
jgi:hypothetical protein